MRILYYYPEYDTYMFKWQRYHFFQELEKKSITIVAFNPLIYHSWDEANEKVLNEVYNGSYDLFMTCICNEHMLYIDTLLEIKRVGIPTLSFRPDNLIIPYNDKVLAPFFDLVWLTAKETKYLYDRWRVRTMFAPYAANPEQFVFHSKPFKRSVCFIGNPYGSRAKMINFLTGNGIKTDLFYGGNIQDKTKKQPNKFLLSTYSKGWYNTICDSMKFEEGRIMLRGLLINKMRKGSILIKNECLSILPSVPFEKISSMYSEYVLSLASTSTNHTDVLKNPLKVANLRNFEIPMSGGIEFCRYSEEMAGYFEDGKEIIFYYTDEDMIDKANYYTRNASDRELYQIKVSARKRAENEHTWSHRFSKAFATLGLKVMW